MPVTPVGAGRYSLFPRIYPAACLTLAFGCLQGIEYLIPNHDSHLTPNSCSLSLVIFISSNDSSNHWVLKPDHRDYSDISSLTSLIDPFLCSETSGNLPLLSHCQHPSNHASCQHAPNESPFVHFLSLSQKDLLKKSKLDHVTSEFKPFIDFLLQLK